MEQEDLSIVAMFPATSHRSLQELTLHIGSPDGTSQKIFAWGGDTSVDMSEEPRIKARDKLEVQCTYRASDRSITVSEHNTGRHRLIRLAHRVD